MRISEPRPSRPPVPLERQALHTLVASAATVALSFGTNVLLARELGPAGKGVLDVILATTALLTLLFGLSLPAAVIRFTAQRSCVPMNLAVPLLGWIALTGALIAGAFAFAPKQAIGLGLLPDSTDVFWIAYLAAGVAIAIAAALLRGVLIGLRAMITVNRAEIAAKASVFLLVALATLVVSANPKAYALILLVGNAAMLLAFTLLLRAPAQRIAGAGRELLRSSLPLHGANVFLFFTHRADVFFIQAQHGSNEVGIYVLATLFPQVLVLGSSAFSLPLLGDVSAQTDAAAAAQAAARVARLFVAAALAGAVVIAATMGWALPMIFGRDFAPSVPPLMVLLPGAVAYGLSGVLVSYFFGRGHAGFNFTLSVVGLVITVIGNLTLTPRHGAIGAAITSTLAYGCSGALALAGLARFGKLTWREMLRPRVSEFNEFAGMLRRFRF